MTGRRAVRKPGAGRTRVRTLVSDRVIRLIVAGPLLASEDLAALSVELDVAAELSSGIVLLDLTECTALGVRPARAISAQALSIHAASRKCRISAITANRTMSRILQAAGFPVSE